MSENDPPGRPLGDGLDEREATITISEQTIRWVEAAVKDYDPLTATTGENTPEKLACWAVWCQLNRDPYLRLAETLDLLDRPDEELPGMWSHSDLIGGETDASTNG